MSAEPGPPRLRVGVVGVGRCGAVIAAALDRAGHRVLAVNARSEMAQMRAAALLPGAERVEKSDVFAGTDLVLLAVPDDALPELVAEACRGDWVRPGQFLVHVSGRYGTGVLDPATELGALPLALHPVMTFTGTTVDLDRLVDCPFGVTAPESLQTVAQALVVEIGGDPMVVAEESRPLYHAALAHGANHLVTVVAEAMELLAVAGVQDPGRMLTPLLTAGLANTLARGDQALTGPVSRGDVGTVRDHLDVLTARSTATADVYRALARRTADRALTAGRLQPERAAGLLGVLADEGPGNG